MTGAWYNEERVRQPGSSILNQVLPDLAAKNAERRRLVAAGSAPVVQPMATSMSISDFNDYLRGIREQSTGIVSERSAMCISSVYACVSLIAGAVTSLPLKFYRDSEKGREEYKPDEWWMLNEQAYPCWAASAAWEYAMWSRLLQGDSFWRIHRASRLSPKIVGFEPLHPRTVEVARYGDRLIYRVSAQPSQTGAEAPVTLDQDDMLHVPGPGFDGLRSLSQISSSLAAPGSIALAADQYAVSFFKNGSRPDYVLKTAGNMTPDQMESMRAQLAERYGGPTRAFRPMVLAGGLEVQPITMTAADSQLIEQRRFQVEDIARIFGVPPHMIGHTQSTTSWGSGVEQMSIGFVKYTLQRHLVAIEQEINRKVFRTAGRFCEFDTAGLERGDIKTRNEAYRIALGRAGEKGWMTVNDIRARENLPPVDGGNDLSAGNVLPGQSGATQVDTTGVPA
jgi:HK97 family phage portal protein